MESRKSLRAAFLVLLYAMSCKIISGFFYLTICGNSRSLLLDILFFNIQICYFFSQELHFPINSDCVKQQIYGNMFVSIYLACW